MKLMRWTRPLAAAAMVLSVAACGGGGADGGVDAPATPRMDGQVPASAAASPNALLRFLKGLATTEVDEPLQVGAFLTGIAGLNRPASVTPAEMLRLNTGIAPTPEASQHRLGVAGGDAAGFPNGRRPKDDVVDVALVAVMGGLCMLNGDGNALQLGADCRPANVPLKDTSLKLHDAVDQVVVPLMPAFPYLATPIPGAK